MMMMMMPIIIILINLLSPGGEEQVGSAECDLLTAQGNRLSRAIHCKLRNSLLHILYLGKVNYRLH